MENKTVRELTCIVCPRGCALKVELDGKKVLGITGNLCKRGLKYAEDECMHPMRTVTTTVKVSDGGVVAVKTAEPIPKEKMFECMEIIARATAKFPIHIGDTVIENACGVKIIATQNRE